MRFASVLAALALVLAAHSAAAWAGPALDDPAQGSASTGDATSSDGSQVIGPATPAAGPAASDNDVHYGVDLRFRGAFVPKSILQLFVTRAAGGASNFGYGLDVIRRRGNLELAIGIEHEQVTVGQGVWIQKNQTVPGDDPDYVLSPQNSQDGGLGWTTLEFTFVNHVPITKWVAFRYGAGAGLGIINGALDHYNVQCAAGATNANPEPACTPARFGGQAQYTDPNGNIIATATQYKYNIPPVFPVVDALVGFQFHPFDKAIINIEGGLHTLPYFGVGIGYFFN